MKKNITLFTTLIIAAILLFLLNLTYGSVVIPFREVWHIIIGNTTGDEVYHTIVLKLRLPAAIAAATAGVALSTAGLSMQTLFRNPLAESSILGISSGASLGVALVTLVSGKLIFTYLSGNMVVLSAAFVGAMMILILIALLAQRVSTTTLLLIGVMLSFSVSAVTGILPFFASKEGLQSFVIWGMGSFKNVTVSQSLLSLTTASVLVIVMFFHCKGLNVFSIGELYAVNSGIKIRRLTTSILLLAGGLTAITTAFCGPIAFIGLMTPHFSRMLFKTFNHRVLIFACILMGMSLMLLCNMIATLPGSESILPINAITSIIGAPVVIFLILKKHD
jgi:iron complex transport system permease protein